LDHRLPLLTGGPRDLPERQQTLRATLAWSYELLTPAEQAVFRRICVFAGGCALEAAEAVCAAGDGLEVDMLDWLGTLVEQSLLRREGAAGDAPRFTLLETVREYGLERLVESGEAEGTRARHAAYYLALAEQAEPELLGSRQGQWLDQLEHEHGNLRAALGWARERASGGCGLRLAAAVWRFWKVRGYLSEEQDWLEEMLRCDAGAPDQVRAAALNGAGLLAWRQGDLARTRGDHGRARTLYEESLAMQRELGPGRGLADALLNLGNVAFEQGEMARAGALYEESLAAFRQSGHTWGIAIALNNLGLVERELGNPARAQTLLEEALTLQRGLDNTEGMADSLSSLGELALKRGDLTRARALCAESLSLQRRLGGGTLGLADGLVLLAVVAAAPRRRAERSARLLGAANALRGAIGAPAPPRIQDAYEHVGAARAARRHGRGLSRPGTPSRLWPMRWPWPSSLSFIRMAARPALRRGGRGHATRGRGAGGRARRA